MAEKGTFYGVSVGPGDPELLTLKAARVLAEADVIASPSIGSGLQTARRIIERYIEGKEVLDCSTPMTRDKEASARAYDAIADKLGALLDELALNGELEDAVLQFLRGHLTTSCRSFFPFAVSRYFCVGERGELGCVISTSPSFRAGAR